jgi:hypothetical protein
MIFNDAKDDCILCPYSCSGCEYSSQLANSSIYSSKCLSCNQKVEINNFGKYEIEIMNPDL